MLDGTSGTILSPNYPSEYPNNAHCMYEINVPEGMVVRLSMDEFDIENHDMCVWDALEFIDPAGPPVMMCGSDYDGCDFVSSGNYVTVLFRTDGSVTNGGFALSYEAVEQGTQAQDQCGTVAAPLGCGAPERMAGVEPVFEETPHPYPNDVHCAYTITAPEGMVVQISVHDFALESHYWCVWDSLVFEDLSTGDTTTMCGTDAAGCNFVSSGSSVAVVFDTDGSVTDYGFSLSYQAVAAGTDAQNTC